MRCNSGAKTDGPFWSAYAQQHQLFHNLGAGNFREISAANPALCGTPAVGRGLIVADFDNDRALDMLTTEISGPARLYRNIAPARGHWLTVRAVIPQLHRDAYGAEIFVTAGNRTYWRLIQPGTSYCSSGDPRAHFGLGPASAYDSIRVIWPDGSEESFPGGAADRQIELLQRAAKNP